MNNWRTGFEVGAEHAMATSSVCRQLCLAHGSREHSKRLFSVPSQPISSSQMGPLPWPNTFFLITWAGPSSPIIRHNTCMISLQIIIKYIYVHSSNSSIGWKKRNCYIQYHCVGWSEIIVTYGTPNCVVSNLYTSSILVRTISQANLQFRLKQSPSIWTDRLTMLTSITKISCMVSAGIITIQSKLIFKKYVVVGFLGDSFISSSQPF